MGVVEAENHRQAALLVPGLRRSRVGPDSGPRLSPEQVEASARAIAPDPPNLKNTVLARDTRQPLHIDLAEIDLAVIQNIARKDPQD